MKPGINLNRMLLAGLITVSVGLIVFIAALVYQRTRVRHLTLAAGSPTGESYIIGSALKDVIEKKHREIRIDLRETGGTVESLKLLDEGRADLAAAQADVATPASARILAVLYDDTFQLLSRPDSQVHSFSELRGRVIAVARSGGQFQSFLRVAEHFGLRESDFHFAGNTDADADETFLQGRADAVFRVRALGNPAILDLIQRGKGVFLPIGHAAAMKIAWPAFEPTVVPAGAYLGNPPVPPQDLPSVAVHRTLLASAAVDDETVRAITQTLMDDRQEIARSILEKSAPVRLLLAQARRPETQSQLGPAVHAGALKFYEKDKPSFVQSHADVIGILLTIVAMGTSWIWELRAWLARQQKNVADDYSNRAIALMNAVKEAETFEALEEARIELLDILTAAVHDLHSDNLSEESFESFRTILQLSLEAVRDRRHLLQHTGQFVHGA